MDPEFPTRQKSSRPCRRPVIYLCPSCVWHPSRNSSQTPTFLPYINDLPQKVNSTACLFADDSLLYLKTSSTADTAALQRVLDKLQQLEEDWQMSFNPSKCQVARVTKRRNPVEAIYQIHGHDLTVAKTGKFLGVTISEDLSGSLTWLLQQRRQIAAWHSFEET